MFSNREKRPTLPTLTGIRFFAALQVLFFHSLSVFGAIPKPFYNIVKHGYTGVSLFFVLSGFILAYNYSNSTTTIHKREFWLNRLIRIYPTYCFSLVLVFPLFLYFLLRTLPSTLAIGKAAVVTILSSLLLQSWLPWTLGQLNGPGWSLSVEAFLYFLFPFASVRLATHKVYKLIIFLISFWILSLLPPSIYLLIQPDKNNFQLFEFPLLDSIGSTYPIWRTFVTGFPLFHLPQFLVGICAGILFLKQVSKEKLTFRQCNWKQFIFFSLIEALLIIILLSLFVIDKVPPELLNNGVLAPLYGGIFYVFALSKGIFTICLSNPTILLLGEASYAMYLFQVPLQSWLDVVGQKIYRHNSEASIFILYCVGLIIFSIWFFLLDLRLQRFVKKYRLGATPLSQFEKRDCQLPATTYYPLVNIFLSRYYRWIDHPSKLRLLRYLETLLGNRRIVTTTKYGFSIAVDKTDLIQRSILYDRQWEADLSALLKEELTEEDIFLDIGANVGYFTCFALAHKVKQVIACEPDPLNCEMLKLNFKLNSFDASKLLLLEKGLGRSQSRLTFNRAHVSNTGISGFNSCNAVATFDVEVDTLDHLVGSGQIPVPTVVKMDVEGWEEHVLSGALNLLKQHPPRLIIFEAICDDAGEIINQELVILLRKHGFAITQSLLSDYGCNHIARYKPQFLECIE